MSKVVYLSDVKRTLLEMSKERTRSVGWGDVLMERLKDSSIDIVHCEDCRWRDDCSQTVANFEKTVNTVLRWCSDGVRIDNE